MAFEQAAGDLAHGDRVVDHHHQQRPMRFDLDLLPRGTLGYAGLHGADRRQQIQNQHHPAVPENRRPGHPLHRRKLRPQALDHDFASAGHGIHQHRDVPFVALHQQHRQWQALAQQLRARAGFQQLTQIAQLVMLAGVFVGWRIEAEIPFEFIGQNANDAVDGIERDRVLVLTALHHQRPVDRYGKRQANAEMHALPRHRVDAHGAAQLPHLFVHHVHADAAPGDLGDFFGGGKPRLQDELQHVVITDDAVRGEQAALDRLAPHRVQRYTGAVVADVENDVAAFAQQIEGDFPLGRLPRRQPHFNGLQAMIDGVAQHVFQRRGHAFENAAVHFTFGVVDDEVHVLAQFAGHLPDDALQTREHAFERHHARAHQAFLQFGVDAALLLQEVFRVLIASLEGFLEVEQVRSRLEQCPGQLLQL
ncbi:hypothetical protein D3C76_860080 [compost metagenome]